MKTTLFSILLLCGFSLSANAQAPTAQEKAAFAVKYNQAQEANRNVMKNYSWQYRTEVWENDQLQWADLVNVNIGADGNPIYTQINREQITAEKRGLFGRKGAKQQKGFEQKDKIVDYISKWVTFYARLPADRVHTLFLKAVQEGNVQVSPSSSDVVGVSSSNIRDSNAHDNVTLWFNKSNGHPIRLSFVIPVEKSLDGAVGETVNAVINFRYLNNGEAFYPDHADITVPSRNLKVKIENLQMNKKL